MSSDVGQLVAFGLIIFAISVTGEWYFIGRWYAWKMRELLARQEAHEREMWQHYNALAREVSRVEQETEVSTEGIAG